MRKIDLTPAPKKPTGGPDNPLMVHSAMHPQRQGMHTGGRSHSVGTVVDGGTQIASSAKAVPHAYSGDVGKAFTGVQVPTKPGMRSRVHDLPHAPPGFNHFRAQAQKEARHAMAQATGSACLDEAYSFGNTQDRMARPKTGTKPKAAQAGWLSPGLTGRHKR
jgi:hypothetical protein